MPKQLNWSGGGKKKTHFRLNNKTCLVVTFVLQSAHSYLSIAHRRIPIISQTVSWPALLLVLPVGDKNQCHWGSCSCYHSRGLTMVGLQRVRCKLIWFFYRLKNHNYSYQTKLYSEPQRNHRIKSIKRRKAFMNFLYLSFSLCSILKGTRQIYHRFHATIYD